MKVTSVRYERLFSLEKYHNERICFEARLDEGESEDQAIGKLFFKVAEIEDVFQAYRNCLDSLAGVECYIRDDLEFMAATEKRIMEMKVSIDKLSRGEPDDRLRAACDRESLKSLQAHLEERRETLERHEMEHQTLTEQLKELKDKIKQGDFSPDKTVKSLLKTRQVEVY